MDTSKCFGCLFFINIVCGLQHVSACVTQTYSDGNSVLTLSCLISNFTNFASWSLDGNGQQTRCLNDGFCTVSINGNYNFTSDNDGIYNRIYPYSSTEVGKVWKCDHPPIDCNTTVNSPAESDVTTEGSTEGLISAMPSSETTSEMESSFLEVTGTDDISNVLASFESTDFTFKPGTSLNANTLSLEDSLSQISSLSPIGSLEPTELLNNEYKTTEIEVDSTLFSFKTFNFTDETFKTRSINSAMSTSMVTSTRNNLPISSVSVLYITTGISLQVDLTQSRDLHIPTSEIIQNTQTRSTSLFSSVLLHTKTLNIQTDTFPFTLSARFDAKHSDTLSLQSSLDSFIKSLVSKNKLSADTFSLSIETSPASPVLPVDTSSNNQIYTSGDPWSVSQTEYVLENTLIVDTFTSYDNSFSSFQIASSTEGTSYVQVLPIDTSVGEDYSSVDSFSPVEGFSISLFPYTSSLSQGQPIYTSITHTLALFDVSSISLMVHSSYISVKSVVPSSERSLINSFLSFTDTFTLDRNDQSANESVTSMVFQSLNLYSSNNHVAFSSHTLSDSQFLPFTGTSQPKLIATSSVNHFTQSDALLETFKFTQLNTSSTPQSYHANKDSNVLSSTNMNFLSVDTPTFGRSGQSMHLSTYSSNPSVDSSTTEQPVNTPFVSTEFQFINTPLFTSVPVFLDTSSFGKFSPLTGLPFGTPSVFGDFATESMLTTIHLSSLSPSSTLKVSSYTDVTTFSEIISSHSHHLVTSDINSIQPSETVHVFSSQMTSTTAQAPELSFLEAQIIIVSCSIAVVILVVFVPLMVMYYLGKLERSKIRQKPHDQSENDSSSSVNFPQVFNRDFDYDYPNMAKTIPVRYHSRSLSDLPYSWDFENNWNSLTS